MFSLKFRVSKLDKAEIDSGIMDNSFFPKSRVLRDVIEPIDSGIAVNSFQLKFKIYNDKREPIELGTNVSLLS